MVDQLHRVKRARSFNDALRHEMPHGSVRISHEVGQRFGNDELRVITQLIQDYDTFGHNDDPDELHDTGIIEFEGVQLVWRIGSSSFHHDCSSRDKQPRAGTERWLRILLADQDETQTSDRAA